MYFLSSLISWAALFHLTLASYVLEDDYMKDFYGNFDFFTADDPTSGMSLFLENINMLSNVGRLRRICRPINRAGNGLNQVKYNRSSIVGGR